MIATAPHTRRRPPGDRSRADRAPADRAYAALYRALRPRLGDHHLLSGASRDWASATFVGARHRLVVALAGEDAASRADRLCATIADAELPISGGFVADIVALVRIGADRTVLTIEALTIEDGDTW